MNPRKRIRSRSRSYISRREYKKRRCSSVTSSDSTSTIESKSEYVSLRDDRKKFVRLLDQVRSESKYLINCMTPIVLCCPYQNPIRCAYRLLHKNLEDIVFLMDDDLNEKDKTAQIGVLASNLTDNVITLVRILKTVKIIQEKRHRINKPLEKFELYVTHMKLILNYVVHVLLNTKLTIFKSETHRPAPFSFRRLECRFCKDYVTFYGCRCTRWKYDTVPSQTIQNQLLSPVEDGPMSSNQSYITDWHDLKECVYKLSSLKHNIKNEPRVKERTLHIIDREQTN